jgi:hypothetical protein
MTARLRPLGVAVVLSLLLPLAGCGGNSIDEYCTDLTSHQKEMSEMLDSTSRSALLTHLPMLRDLADKSPKDLTDEWQTFLGAIEGLDKAIKAAGVKPSDFQDDKPPAGLSATDRKAIADAADQILTDEVKQAAAGIEQEARDVCKVNLGV